MNAFLTAAAFLVLVAVAAYVIHRLNLQHAERIAAYRYGAPRPGRRGRCVPQPYYAPRVIIRTPVRASEPSAQTAATRAGAYTRALDRAGGPGPVDRGI